MSDEDHSTTQKSSENSENSVDQDAKVEENNGVKTDVEETAEGYQTPTSEEHKIPQVALSPPPPPRKRKREGVNGRNIRKVEVFKGKFVADSTVKLLFGKAAAERVTPPPPPPPPVVLAGPDPDLSASPKKRHTEE